MVLQYCCILTFLWIASNTNPDDFDAVKHDEFIKISWDTYPISIKTQNNDKVQVSFYSEEGIAYSGIIVYCSSGKLLISLCMPSTVIHEAGSICDDSVLVFMKTPQNIKVYVNYELKYTLWFDRVDITTYARCHEKWKDANIAKIQFRKNFDKASKEYKVSMTGMQNYIAYFLSQ